MSEFRGPLPLNDRQLAEIRARVLEKIERPSPLRFAVPAFALAAAAVAIAFLLLPHQHAPQHAPRPAAFGVPRPAAAALSSPSVKTAPAPKPIQVAEKAAPRRRTPKAAGSPPPDNEISIEIHTADPDVRIIWIASR